MKIACGPTVGGRCRGTLQLVRGRRILAGRSFSIRASRITTVKLRIGAREYRRLSRRRSARVTVILLTRGSDGELRRVARRVGLRRR